MQSGLKQKRIRHFAGKQFYSTTVMMQGTCLMFPVYYYLSHIKSSSLFSIQQKYITRLIHHFSTIYKEDHSQTH